MKTDMTQSSLELAEQRKINRRLQEKTERQSKEIGYLKEQVGLLLSRIYGKRSEKRQHDAVPSGQLNFLDLAGETTSPDEVDVPAPVPIAAHTCKKSGRKPLPESLPRVERVHDIPDDRKQCACGSALDRIGEERSEQLDYVPARLRVVRHIRPKYACKSCEGIETEGSTVKIAPPPKRILPKSIASPSLLAQIVTSKFVDSLPFYRQEKQFSRLGVEISRSNMANWTIQLSGQVSRLLELLTHEILSGPLIHMDETTLQVL